MRLHPRYRLKVSNIWALIGAFLLAASVLAGVSVALPALQGQATTAAEIASFDGQAGSAPNGVEPNETAKPVAAGNHKRFKVNLFLFRH